MRKLLGYKSPQAVAAHNRNTSRPDKIAFIATMPKAGTYLIGAILERLGFHNTRWHLHADHVTKAVPGAYGSSVSSTRLFSAEGHIVQSSVLPISIEQVLFLANPGDVIHTHLPPHMIPYRAWPTIKVFCGIRNPYDLLQSQFLYLRSLLLTSLDDTPSQIIDREAFQEFDFVLEEETIEAQFLAYVGRLRTESALMLDLLHWHTFRDCLTIRFEDLRNEKRALGVMQEIASFIERPMPDHTLLEIWRDALTADSPTKGSPSRYTHAGSLWSAEHYTVANRWGIAAIAEHLGYSVPTAEAEAKTA